MERTEHVTLDIQTLADSLNLGTTQSEQRPSESSPQALGACIYRVPKSLRGGNGDVCTPQVISIGPHHHDNPELQRMNDHKERFLEDFLNRSQIPREKFVKFIEDREERLRSCYFESIAFKRKDLVEIVLKDAAFVLELFYRDCFLPREDGLTSKPVIAALIFWDMLLIENQLPFFIIQELLDFADIKAPREAKNIFMQNEKLSLAKLTLAAYSGIPDCRMRLYSMEDFESSNVSHFLDFVRVCYLPPRNNNKRKSNPSVSSKKRWTGRIPTATKLQEAGVQFRKAGKEENLFDVNFNCKNGLLEIPYVVLNSRTEVLFRSLVIFEQLHYISGKHFTDYMRFLDYLVDEPKDVEILNHNRIVDNRLGDNAAAATFLNNVTKGRRQHTQKSKFYFSDICDELQSYYRSPRNRFMANFKQRYLNFSSPWAAISVLAGFVLLVLTFLQTVYSIRR